MATRLNGSLPNPPNLEYVIIVFLQFDGGKWMLILGVFGSFICGLEQPQLWVNQSSYPVVEERFISFLRPYNNFSALKYTFYLEKLCFKVGLRRSVKCQLEDNTVKFLSIVNR